MFFFPSKRFYVPLENFPPLLPTQTDSRQGSLMSGEVLLLLLVCEENDDVQ